MDDVVLVRHGESESAAAGVVGGDAPLTEAGRAQARETARALADRPFDVCFMSPARRALETAALVLEGREVPRIVLADLADIDFGSFSGGSLQEYRAWIGAHDPAETSPGGESRVATLRRFCRALSRSARAPRDALAGRRARPHAQRPHRRPAAAVRCRGSVRLHAHADSRRALDGGGATRTVVRGSRMVIGGKAEGLVRLQELQLPVPPFVAVPVGEERRRGGGRGSR